MAARGRSGHRRGGVTAGSCWRRLTRLVAAGEPVRHSVAHRIEETSAAVDVTPALGVPPLRIVAQEQMDRPGLVAHGRAIGGTGDMRLASVAELVFRAFPAPGTRDQQHDCRTLCVWATGPSTSNHGSAAL